MIDMFQDGVEVFCLPDNTRCKADEEGRSPLDLEKCPISHETCSGGCFYYAEE